MSETQQLLESCAKGDVNKIKTLIDKGVNVNCQDRSGNTPLHMADEGDFETIIKMLIAKGADINKGDKNKWTPLHWAALKGKNDVVKVLLDNGSSVNAKQNDGFTPLMAAINGFYNKMGDYAGEDSEHKFKDTCFRLITSMSKSDLLSIKNNQGFNALDFDNALGSPFVLAMLDLVLK